MYHDPDNYQDASDLISVTVSALSLTTAQPLTVTADAVLRVDRRTLSPDTAEGWGFHTISLALPASADLVNTTVQLHGYANFGNNIYLDDLSIAFYSAVQPPSCATKPFPVDGSTTAGGATALTWTSGQGATPSGFRVVLGSDNPPTNLFASQTISYVVGTAPAIPLALPVQSQLYYWQVIPFNRYGDAPGCPIWRFVTPSP